jgi:4-methyl-5(b-hydroxyethyl)-thiazole monophosphate biosynthesis
MRKNALIILAEGFEEIEAVTCIDLLRRAEVSLTVAGLRQTHVNGSHGITLIADKALAAVGADFDALILPGGMPGSANLAASEKVTALIKQMHAAGKLIAAICAAPALVLAPCGVLNHKAATCFPGMEDNFGQTTRRQEDPVVIDGNIITSRGPGTAFLFALAIAEKLSGRQTADQLRRATLAG